MLDYLQNQHGISTHTVYNDLHGFIRNQGIHKETYITGYEVKTHKDEDIVKIETS